jgi:hypothetical protein
MTFSLNEVEAMGKRAARGAGRDWGIAEEAGKAARWLTARGLPGPELLAELLTRNEGKSYEELAPARPSRIVRRRSRRGARSNSDRSRSRFCLPLMRRALPGRGARQSSFAGPVLH